MDIYMLEHTCTICGNAIADKRAIRVKREITFHICLGCITRAQRGLIDHHDPCVTLDFDTTREGVDD